MPEAGTVAALTHEGMGVIRGDSKTVFVPGTLPGERIEFERGKRHRQYDEGRVLAVLEASPDRVAPRCGHFGVCGGCALQHLSAAGQLAAKQAGLRDNLERLARVEPKEWLPPLLGPQWGYRRRARLGAKYVAKKGRVLVGFRERLAPYIAALDRCEVLAPPLDGLIVPLSELLTSLSIRRAVPQIEVAVADNAVALVLRVMEDPSAADIETLEVFAATHGLRFYLQRHGLDSVRPLGAADPLYYTLPGFDLKLEFLPTDFVQINAAVNQALVKRAIELLELKTDSRVLDLFCGLGNFTLPMARHAQTVTGVEGDAALVSRARHNAALNGVANAVFHTADLSKEPLPEAAWMRGPYTHVLLDPPRAGAREVLAAIARFAPQRVLYISCHPGSLARDIGILVHELGFGLRAAGVLDMFPHTTHVESMVLLERT